MAKSPSSISSNPPTPVALKVFLLRVNEVLFLRSQGAITEGFTKVQDAWPMQFADGLS
jgi:hypothetical protein